MIFGGGLNAVVGRIDDDELEKWYDNAFHMFLACMAVIPYIDLKEDLKMLKSE